MIYIGGHSLGAARAWLYAYARIARGMPVDGVYACGSPRPGDDAIGRALTPSMCVRSLKNGPDTITKVPFDIELLDEQYTQPTSFTSINEPPSADDEWGPLGWHHIELYQAGSRKLAPSGTSLELVTAVDAIARLYKAAVGWDWIDTTDGHYAAMQRFGEDKLLVFRGSTTGLDWLEDFAAWQIEAFGARMSAGFWAGVGPVLEKLDAALA